MFVRKLEQHEIMNALHLAWDVFAETLIPETSKEGIEAFQKMITYENVEPKVQAGEMIFFGAFHEDILCGTGAIRNDGEICLLYVREFWRRKGIGRMIFQEMCRHLSGLGIKRITVKAPKKAIDIFQHLGMQKIVPEVPEERKEESVEELVEEPVEEPESFSMEMIIAPKMVEKKNKKNKWLWLLILIPIVIFILFAVLVGLFTYKVTTRIMKDGVIEFHESYGDEWFGSDIPGEEGYGGFFGGEEPEVELGGLESIPEYIDKNLEYELAEESYILNPEETETTRTTIAFEIIYPQITGLDPSVEDKVNEELKNCAMETADRIYFNPTDEIKETVLGQQYPLLASYVEYKVTYLSEELLCVVYQDYCYEGSEEAYSLELRTRTINLTDGTIYEIEDLVRLDEAFLSQWKETMRAEANEEALLSELSDQEMKEVLSGNDMGGVYKDNFFLDADGIEIGLAFFYPVEDENNHGFAWVTAPFSWKELEDHKTDSEFWNLIK